MNILKQAWAAWKRIGRIIGDAIGRVVLTLFYCTIFVPFGLAVRLLSDPLRLKPESNASYWLPRETRDRALDDARQQF
jgi:hypothetical protein